MAMSKKEQQLLAECQQQLRLAKALRFTELVYPDVPIPDRWNRHLVKGWLYAGSAGSFRVDVACSSCTSHAFGRDDGVTQQEPQALYSSRLLALKAARNALEQQCASWLARLDTEIENEKGGS